MENYDWRSEPSLRETDLTHFSFGDRDQYTGWPKKCASVLGHPVLLLLLLPDFQSN